MNSSVRKLSKLALSMLSAALLFSLAGASAYAQAPLPFVSKRTPGQVTITTGKAAVVVETVHYQATLTLSCDKQVCIGDFPSPGARRRLNITRMACVLGGTRDSAFAPGMIQLVAADNSLLPQSQILPGDHSVIGDYPVHYHALNRAVDMQIAAKQRMRASLYLLSGSTFFGECTATGTLDTLQ